MLATMGAHHLAAARRVPLLQSARCFSSLTPKINQFAADVAAHLPADGKGVAFASAWLATDNAIVGLFKQATPAVFDGMSLVGVDTLHLFPTTYDVQLEVEAKYGKLAHVTKPIGCESTADFDVTCVSAGTSNTRRNLTHHP